MRDFSDLPISTAPALAPAMIERNALGWLRQYSGSSDHVWEAGTFFFSFVVAMFVRDLVMRPIQLPVVLLKVKRMASDN